MATQTPGSLYSSAPRTRNSSPNSVFPVPGPPQTSAVRPLGKPPCVTWSRPRIPVGTFSSTREERPGEVDFFFFCTARAGIFFVFSQKAEFLGTLEPDILLDDEWSSWDEAALAELLPSCEARS